MNSGLITTGDHCRLAWRSDGRDDAPALILSNSLGTHMAMWDPQVAVLAERFRVIRYDGRGHGQSDVPSGAYSIDRLGRDVIELADQLGIDKFDFCGLSLGGMVGQWLGWRAPERLGALVIANSSPFMGPPSAWDARIDKVAASGMESIADAILERWFTPTFRGSPTFVDDYLDMLLATDQTGYAGCCAAIRDMDMRPALPLIATRTLVIGGIHDPATPPDHSRLIADSVGEAALVLVPAAHLANCEAPDEFNRALASFFAI